jgi:hypothetical protein
MNPGIKLGKYRHYKGGQYELVGIATHSETFEYMAVYKCGEGKWWVRPLSMWGEHVQDGDKLVKRFELVEDGGD